MKGPILVGVMAALLVSVVAVGLFLALALGRPGPALPTMSPIALHSISLSPAPTSPAPTSHAPTGSAEPSASASAPPMTPSPSPSVGVGLEVGDMAPALAVPGLDGSEIDTALLAGQPIWINFMATWCPPCRDELPVMERLGAQLGEEMTILVVDVGEDEETVTAFMTSLGVELPVGLDEAGVEQREWGAFALPVHYWVGADGRIGGFLYGGAGPEQFIEGVQTVLPDASLEP